MGPRGFEPLTYGFEDRYDIHFTKDPLVVDKGYDPFRFSPSDRSPGIIRPRRTPVLSTILFGAGRENRTLK